MAFCSQCGASVAGVFCTRCGAKSAAAAAPAASPTSAAPAPAPSAAPPRRRTSPIVWVLVILIAVFGLGALGVAGMGAFFLHKAKLAGVDADLWRTDPGLAVGRVMAAVNPNLEVLRTNSDRTVTLRDRHTGKEFSISIDAARSGRFSLKADDNGKTASVEFGGDAKVPSWVPVYPGAQPRQIFAAKGETDRDAGEAGSYTFDTDDPSSKVVEFYEQKARELDLPLRGSGFGTVTAGDEDRGRWMKVVTSGSKVTVTYGRKF